MQTKRREQGILKQDLMAVRDGCRWEKNIKKKTQPSNISILGKHDNINPYCLFFKKDIIY